jgi:hypothetical protein
MERLAFLSRHQNEKTAAGLTRTAATPETFGNVENILFHFQFSESCSAFVFSVGTKVGILFKEKSS